MPLKVSVSFGSVHRDVSEFEKLEQTKTAEGGSEAFFRHVKILRNAVIKSA
ncbi:MAG: hypothetical protein LUE29_10750 [Lachnospiraceae bacterium]|nr:hypothetical protein [Lachnospiraceae bacterium]